MATEYGNRLKKARLHAGLNQVQLGKVTGISQSTISTAERLGNGSTDTAVYAKACGVSAHWLETGDGEMLAATATATLAAPSSTLAATGSASNQPLARIQQAQAAIPNEVKALAVIYAAIAPEFRNAAISAATNAMISFLSPHTTPAQDVDALDTKPFAESQFSRVTSRTP